MGGYRRAFIASSGAQPMLFFHVLPYSGSSVGWSDIPHQAPDLCPQDRQQLGLEPGVGHQPSVVAPGWVRQGDTARHGPRSKPFAPAPNRTRHATIAAALHVPALGIAADRQDEL